MPLVEAVLKGASIATIQDSNGYTSKIVIFRPSKQTHENVRIYEDRQVDLVIEDVNGRFTPKRRQVIVDSVYESGNDTMVVTTVNM